MPQPLFGTVIILFCDALNIILAGEKFPGAPAESRWLERLCMREGLSSLHAAPFLGSKAPGASQAPFIFHTHYISLLHPNLHKTISPSFCIDNICFFFSVLERAGRWGWLKGDRASWSGNGEISTSSSQNWERYGRNFKGKNIKEKNYHLLFFFSVLILQAEFIQINSITNR